MNKSQLVEAVALDANISKVDARKAVDAIIRVTVHSLRQGERLTLTGLGTFSVQQKPARMGHLSGDKSSTVFPFCQIFTPIIFRPGGAGLQIKDIIFDF